MYNADKAKFFSSRLNECMQKEHLSKTAFAKKLNSNYNTSYTHNDVRRWLNCSKKVAKQDFSHKNSVYSFPKMETIINIANFFNVDIGYLIGEIDMETYSLEKASSYTGLSMKALKSVRDITKPESSSVMYEEIRTSLSIFLSSPHFSNIVDDLLYLYQSSNIYNMSIDDIDSCYDQKNNTKLAKYDIMESLILLLNEAYPKPTI